MQQIYVKVGLWIKAETPQEAVDIARTRLQSTLSDWYSEDTAPYPAGSLLLYGFLNLEDAVNDGGPSNPAQFSNDNG